MISSAGAGSGGVRLCNPCCCGGFRVAAKAVAITDIVFSFIGIGLTITFLIFTKGKAWDAWVWLGLCIVSIVTSVFVITAKEPWGSISWVFGCGIRILWSFVHYTLIILIYAQIIETRRRFNRNKDSRGVHEGHFAQIFWYTTPTFITAWCFLGWGLIFMIQNARNVKLHGLENTRASSYRPRPFGNSSYNSGSPYNNSNAQPQFPLYHTATYVPVYSNVQASPPPIGQTYAPPPY